MFATADQPNNGLSVARLLSEPNARTVCSVFMTARTEEWRRVLADLLDALEAAGLEAVIADDALVVDNITLVPQLVERAHPTPADLAELVATGRGSSTPIIVADRISEAGRQVLRDAGWGFFDRRGHLRVWSAGIRIELPLPERGERQPATSNPWTPVGFEVALAALIDPDTPITARRIAPVIGRSVGATHESIGRFRAIGLIGSRTNLPLVTDLFWETSAHWPDDEWSAVSVELDELVDRVGADELVRVDERAATLGGARIPAAGELAPRLYVRSASALRRARSLGERDDPARLWIRRPPIRWLPLNDDHEPDPRHPWAIAHPMLCALRLAVDPARGREIVEDWGLLPDDDAWSD